MRRLPFRLPLAFLALAALLLAGCADEGEIGGPTIGGSLAVTVGDFQYTHADLEAEIEQWATDPAVPGQAFGVPEIGEPGRRSALFVSTILQFRIFSEQSRQLGRATGFEPDPADVAQFVTELRTNFIDQATGAPLLSDYPDEFLESLAADIIYGENLNSIGAPPVDVPVVGLNPRYGTFEDTGRGLGTVNPPSGPLPQPFAPA